MRGPWHADRLEVAPAERQVAPGERIAPLPDAMHARRPRRLRAVAQRPDGEQIVPALPTADSQRRTATSSPPAGASGPAAMAAARSISAFDALSRRSVGGRIGDQQGREQHRVAPLDADGCRTGDGSSGSLELGKELRGGAALPPEPHQVGDRARGDETLEPFVAHPLRRQTREARRLRATAAVQVGGLDGEIEPRGETDRAKNAKVVLAKTLRRLADGAHDAPPQIGLAAERIAPFVTERMVRERVDREVSAGEIVVERDAITHDGVSAVGGDVAPEGGHLVHRTAAVDHADRSVLLAHRRRALEQRLHLIGLRRRGEVVVGVRMAQQRVTQRAAHAPRLESRPLERAGDLENFVGNRERAGKVIGAPYGTPAESAIVSSIRAWDGVRGPAGSTPIATVRAPPPSKA